MCTNRLDIGDMSIFVAPSMSMDRSWDGVSKFRCQSAHCLGFDGCVPRGRVGSLPYGMGLPVPDGWACVPTELVPAVLPEDFGATMLRLAVVAGRRGLFFLPDVKTHDPSPVSAAMVAEIHSVSGSLKYAGSLWLNKAAGDNPSLSLVDGFRPLLVSGLLGWGTKAVFDAYVSAFSDLGVRVAKFEYDYLRRMFTQEVVLKMLLAECVDKRNTYTHLLVTDGLSVPSWLLDSCGLTKVVISTEDPYSLDVTSAMHPYYDYVLTNESTVAEGFGIGYLPTAADITRCAVASKRAAATGKKQYDVCFIGAVYPERKKMLISVESMCRKNGLKMFAGGTCRDEDLPDMPFFTRGEFSTDNMLLAQASSRICLNMFRQSVDGELRGNSKYAMEAHSMNPRCYDAPACGAALLTDYRPEVESVYGTSCVFEPGGAAAAVYSLARGENAEESASLQSKEVVRSHTYTHRAIVMLAMLEKGIVSA